MITKTQLEKWLETNRWHLVSCTSHQTYYSNWNNKRDLVVTHDFYYLGFIEQRNLKKLCYAHKLTMHELLTQISFY